MANPVSYYDGNIVTCYPSSNAVDEGKLNLEFNMARLVTRVAKKNFCVVEPSFILTPSKDITTNRPVIQVGEGQASINGMDIIANGTINIDPPDSNGTWYLAFKLVRDKSENVLGDRVVGVSKTFEGLSLTYYKERPKYGDEDPDMLFLGSVNWDGNQFTDVEEDPEKYTRLKAEDVGCYINDPKHADTTYMDLQSWMDKVPDWFFSKEGDVCYGEMTLLHKRGDAPSPDNDLNPGMVLRVYDENTVKLVLKAPSLENKTLMRYGDINKDGKIDNTDLALLKEFVANTKTPTEEQAKLACVSGNREGKLTAKDVELLQNYINNGGKSGKEEDGKAIGKTGVVYGIGDVIQALQLYSSNSKTEVDLNKAQLYSNYSDNILHLHNPEGLCFESGAGDVTVKAFNKITMNRFQAGSPVFEMAENYLQVTDSDTPNLKSKLEFTKSGTSELATETFGKSVWQYNSATSYLTLQGTGTSRLMINPSVYMLNAVNRTAGTMYYNDASDYDTPYNGTYMKKNEILLDSNTTDKVFLKMTDRYVYLSDANGGSETTMFRAEGANGNNYFRAYSNGNIDIKKASGATRNDAVKIILTGDLTSHRAMIYHYYNDEILRIYKDLVVDNDLTVTNDAYINGGDLHLTNSANGDINLWFGTQKMTKPGASNKFVFSCPLDLGSNNVETTGDGIFGRLKVGTKKSDGTYPLNVDANGNLSTSGTITGSKVYNAVYNRMGRSI